MDQRIVKFIRRHHVVTLTTIGPEGEPWSCNLFYAFLPEANALVFTSQEHTRHTREMESGGLVSASIVLETRLVGRLQGLQIQGTVSKASAENPLGETARRKYLRRFPYAIFALGELWILSITKLKYTDNTLGFGTKLHWTSEAEEAGWI